MAKQYILASALALALALPAVGFAQQQPPSSSQPAQQQAQARISPDAHHVIDKKAVNAQGKDIGKIKDVLVGPDGKVQALVVDYKGKNRAIPWDQVQLKGEEVSVTMADQELSQLPEYRSSEK
jgi:sporulation protein YlmC with PRC-barrel domain